MHLLIMAILFLFTAASLQAGDVSPQSAESAEDGSEFQGDMEGESAEEYGEVDEDIIIEDDVDTNEDEGVTN